MKKNLSSKSDSNNSLIRTFVAVPISEPNAKELESFVNSLKKLAHIRWVTIKQFHITLRFIGEQTPEIIDQVRTALQDVHFDPFEIELSYAGGFPNLNSPKSIWLSGNQGKQELIDLAKKVNKAIDDATGLEAETRAFKPHLTLARSDGRPLPQELMAALKNAPKLIWACTSFDLMRSKLTPQGAVYSKIPL